MFEFVVRAAAARDAEGVGRLAARTLHVVDLYVGEAWRGRGVGRALMGRAAGVCRALGGTQLFWAVYAPNEAALRFYGRLGARLTRDMLFMRLDV